MFQIVDVECGFRDWKYGRHRQLCALYRLIDARSALPIVKSQIMQIPRKVEAKYIERIL